MSVSRLGLEKKAGGPPRTAGRTLTVGVPGARPGHQLTQRVPISVRRGAECRGVAGACAGTGKQAEDNWLKPKGPQAGFRKRRLPGICEICLGAGQRLARNDAGLGPRARYSSSSAGASTTVSSGSGSSDNEANVACDGSAAVAAAVTGSLIG